MKALEEKIIREGIVKKGNILKVDSFLNHQIDVAFLDEMGKDVYKRQVSIREFIDFLKQKDTKIKKWIKA